jgi:hypothetical protein
MYPDAQLSYLRHLEHFAMRSLGFLLIRFAVGAASMAIAAWIGWSFRGLGGALVALVVTSPLLAVAIARPLLEFVGETGRWLWNKPLEEWEGKFYSFNQVQIRVLEHDDEPWFIAADVLKAIDSPSLRSRKLSIAPGEIEDSPYGAAFSMRGLQKHLLAIPEREAARFLLWAEREVFLPFKKRREGIENSKMF